MFARLVAKQTIYLGVRAMVLASFVILGTTACTSGADKPVAAKKKMQVLAETKTIEETRTIFIDFGTVEREDPTIPEGEKRFARDGKKGRKLVTYSVTYVDGEEQSLKVVDLKILKKPVDEIILVGTSRFETSTPEPVPFVTRSVDDPNMLQETSSLWQKGVEGEKVKVYKVGYEDGKVVLRTFVKEAVTREPIAKVIANGTWRND